jgi:hypothetical protein
LEKDGRKNGIRKREWKRLRKWTGKKLETVNGMEWDWKKEWKKIGKVDRKADWKEGMERDWKEVGEYRRNWRDERGKGIIEKEIHTTADATQRSK